MKIKIISYVLLILLSYIYSINNYNGLLIVPSFLLILMLFGFFIHKTENNFKNKKIIVISILLSLCCCYFSYQRFIGKYNYKKIEIENTSSEKILIDGIYLDGEKVKIDKDYSKKSDVKNSASFKTEYKEQNKNTSSYKGTLDINDKYVFSVNKKRKIEIQIQRKKIDTEVLINGNIVHINKFNYKSITSSAQIMGNYNFIYNINNSYVTFDNIYIYMILLLLFIFNFNIINSSFKNKKMQLLLLIGYILEFNPICSINIITKLILYILFLLFMISINKLNNLDKLNFKYKLLFFISSLYISFSLFGKYIMDDFNLINIIYYFLICLFVNNILFYFIELINYICDKKRNKNNNISKKKLFFNRVAVFFIAFLILYLYQFIFYPYIYLADSYMQINDINNNVLTNWHPYLHTLMLKGFYVLAKGNLFIYIYVRIIICSLLLNSILFYFYKKGMRLLYVYLIAITFSLLPITGIIITTLLKDVDFVIAFVALTFYVYLIFNDFNEFNKHKLNYLFLLLSLIGVGFFRHNGFYVSIVIIIIMLFFSMKTKKKILGITLVLFIVISLIIKFPLYKQLKVKSAPRNFDIATMIHGLDYIMTEEKNEFSASDYKYLTKNVLSYKDFKLFYDKYNIDILLHYNSTKPHKKIRDLKFNKTKLIEIYLKQFIKSPIYLLKDRLFGTDIIWNVIEDDRINVLKYQVLYDEFDSNFKNDYTKKYKIITSILNFISNNNLLNILFFRVGFYIDILIVLTLYQLTKKKKKILVTIIPLLLVLLTLFIAMHYQAFRYVWMVPVITLLLFLFMIFNNNEN